MADRTQGRIIGCMLRAGVRPDASEGITLTSEEPGQNVVSCRATGKLCGDMPGLRHWENQLDHKSE